ncbi:hypothetical protein [Thiofilum flexile]|uniref:hypothetical protein n=1 Tax=Thiofilum flexile TaxID=125627 RepID=UPI00036E433E|nr:hypothetical protein [Thiofilum flexile]
MTDLNKPNEKNTTTENTNTSTAQTNTENTAPNDAQANTEAPQGRCGWGRGGRGPWMGRHHHGNCHEQGGCHGRRRWKVIGGAVLIFILGLMAGKASNHHHRHYGMMGEQATVVVPGERPKPLSAILDSIQATPEQRAKAADLVY